MVEAVKISEPDEIYHLAAQSFVGTSFEQPIGTGEVTGLGVTRILEATRQINPAIWFYQASISELYGRGHSSSLTENSIFQYPSEEKIFKCEDKISPGDNYGNKSKSDI